MKTKQTNKTKKMEKKQKYRFSEAEVNLNDRASFESRRFCIAEQRSIF